MTGSLADRFKSGSQRAGNVTEAWGADNFYCPNCSSPKLDWLKPGTKASDYKCPNCDFWFQLKSQKSRIGNSITDGAYGAMMDAIKRDETPSFYFLHYEICRSRREEAQTSSREFQIESRNLDSYNSRGEIWVVRNLLLVPHFAFPPSAIIKRPPLGPNARRAGWVGCNFDLRRIPADARIEIIRTVKAPHPDPLPQGEGTAIGHSRISSHASGKYRRPNSRKAEYDSPSPWGEGRDEGEQSHTIIVPPAEVRAQFKRVKPFKNLSVAQRGWALDVLNIVRRIVDGRAALRRRPNVTADAQVSPTNEFTNDEVYAFSRELEKLHPDNRHIKDKIRQKLQVLRDAKLLIHVSSGLWRLK